MDEEGGKAESPCPGDEVEGRPGIWSTEYGRDGISTKVSFACHAMRRIDLRGSRHTTGGRAARLMEEIHLRPFRDTDRSAMPAEEEDEANAMV